MAYRRFVDREGRAWDVKDGSDSIWRFEPEPGNPGREVEVAAPGYQKDPFELSTEELQRLLDAAVGSGHPSRPRRPSPFGDD